MPLYLTESDVDELLDIQLAMDAVEGVQARLATGAAMNLPRRRIHQSGRTLHVMAASDEGTGYAGHKSYLASPGKGAAFCVMLYEIESGQLAAVIEAGRLGQLRTGAASGVASKYLARPESERLGIIGGGYQARTQVEAVCRALPIGSVSAYRRNRADLEEFCAAMTGRLGIPVIAANSSAAAVDGADVIITATNSATPVINGNLPAGVHVNAMGSNRSSAAELAPETVGAFDRVVCDDKDQARFEAGDLIGANAAGTFSWGMAITLADVVGGKATGRRSQKATTCFESLGIGAWDVAAAAVVVNLAREKGLGSQI